MPHIPARKTHLVVRAQMEGRAACEDGGATVHRGSRSTILHRITAPSAWTDTTFWEKRLERRDAIFVPGNNIPLTTEKDRNQKSQSYSNCSHLTQIVTGTPPAALILCNKSHDMLMVIW